MTSLAVERRRTGHLPAEVTRFIGRTRELGEVKQGLERSRLVTLRGVGGVGKSRLALRTAKVVRRSFVDGVRLVELSSLREPELLAHTVAEALGLPDQTAGDPLDLLADHLADRQLLLVLDTCEHLVDACAKLAEVLLRAAPRLRILATSREPLDVIGEHALLISPLDAPGPSDPVGDYDSVRLFADRATAMMPGFAITEDNQQAVARLCRRLDGIPLAIELAAVRLRVMSVEQVVERLDHRFRLLGTARTSLDRHQTLHAAIGWSHQLCTPDEQLLWARLSVFPGGFDLEAAERVCATTTLPVDDLFDLLCRLVEKSIVLREPVGDRYRLLDTIREYGIEQLELLGERAELSRRHRDHFLGLAARSSAAALSADQVGWLTRLHNENANLRVALDYSFATPGEEQAGRRMTVLLRHYWLSLGLFTEGRRWHGQALAAPDTPPATGEDTSEPAAADHSAADHAAAERPWLLYGSGVLAVQQGDLTVAAEPLRQAARLAADLGDRDLRAHVTDAQGITLFFAGDLDGAQTHFESALADYAVIGHSDPFALVTPVRLAGVCILTGDLDRAVRLSEECLSAGAAENEQWGRALALWVRGAVRWMSGDLDSAVEDTLGCLRIRETLGDLHGITMSIDLLTVCAAGRGEFERAAVLSGAGDALWETLHAPIQQGPHYMEIRRHAAETARQELGDERFATAALRGRRLSLPDAIALARDEVTPQVPETTPDPLTKREREIAELVALGLSNREIAERLVIAKRTVDSHLEHILAKLDFGSRTQIAAWAARPPHALPDPRGPAGS
jgi:predicted ATPase/DNA-binding CsgD family transcriptional regulator